MVWVDEDGEDVLDESNGVLLEEGSGNAVLLGLREVVDELQGEVQADVGDIAHRVLDGPDSAVHDELELRRRKGDQS